MMPSQPWVPVGWIGFNDAATCHRRAGTSFEGDFRVGGTASIGADDLSHVDPIAGIAAAGPRGIAVFASAIEDLVEMHPQIIYPLGWMDLTQWNDTVAFECGDLVVGDWSTHEDYPKTCRCPAAWTRSRNSGS
jgi:hypothetical protein